MVVAQQLEEEEPRDERNVPAMRAQRPTVLSSYSFYR